MYTSVRSFHETLTAAGVEHVYYESPGTSHEWLTWRRTCMNSRRSCSGSVRRYTHDENSVGTALVLR